MGNTSEVFFINLWERISILNCSWYLLFIRDVSIKYVSLDQIYTNYGNLYINLFSYFQQFVTTEKIYRYKKNRDQRVKKWKKIIQFFLYHFLFIHNRIYSIALHICHPFPTYSTYILSILKQGLRFSWMVNFWFFFFSIFLSIDGKIKTIWNITLCVHRNHRKEYNKTVNWINVINLI